MNMKCRLGRNFRGADVHVACDWLSRRTTTPHHSFWYL